MAKSKPAKAKKPKLKAASEKKPGFRVEDSHAYYIYSLQSASYSRLAEAVRPHGLTTPGWRVVANLQEQDGISLRDLARRTSTDVSNLSKLIAAMEAGGLVTRTRSATDARRVLVHITDAGRKTFEAALPAVRGVLDRSLAGFSDKERARFRGYLQRMMENVGAG